MSFDSTVRPRPPGLSRGFYLVMSLVVSLGPISVDMYLPALPEMAMSLDASAGSTQMTVTAFIFGLMFGPLLAGPVSDAIGRRRPIMAALIVYSLVSLLIAGVGSVEMMIALRPVQALGSGSSFAVARSMFRDVLSGDELAKAMAVLMMIMLGAPIVAPFLGSLLLLVVGWRAIFVVLAVVGALAFLAVWRRLPETLPPERRRALDLATSLRGYRSITRSRGAVAYAVAGGSSAAVLFAYLAASPFIFIEYYGLEEQWFSALFAVGVVGAWLSQAVNIRYVVRIGYRRIVLMGSVSLVALAVVLWWVTRTDLWGLAGVVAVSALAISMTHLVGPGTLTGVLDGFPEIAGSASGFATFVRFAIGGAGSAAVALFNDGTPQTFGVVALAFSAITLAVVALAHSSQTASGSIDSV